MSNDRPLLLDVDGVLADTEGAQMEAWRTWAEEHQLDVAAVLATHGIPARDKIRAFLPNITDDDIRREHYLICREEERLASRATALPGAADAFQSGRKIALVTSGTHHLILLRLEAAQIPLPAVLVTAESTQQGKPHPAPFLKAASLLGEDPRKCDAVEDSPAGIKAARDAGARVIAVTTTFKDRRILRGAGAHFVVADLREALEIPPPRSRR